MRLKGWLGQITISFFEKYLTICQRNGAPGRIRTSDPQIRSLVFYPTELRVQTDERGYIQTPSQNCKLIPGGGSENCGGKGGIRTLDTVSRMRP